MQDFLEVIKIINKNYGIECNLMGNDEDKAMILKHGTNVIIVGVNIEKINTTALVYVVKEYCNMLDLTLIHFKGYESSDYFLYTSGGNIAKS